MALSDDLITLAPEFADADPARIAFFITQASLRINARAWGTKVNLATILLTCHLLKRFAPESESSASGQVINDKIGDLQTQYAPLLQSGDEELSTTTYGAQYAQMRKALHVSMVV